MCHYFWLMEMIAVMLKNIHSQIHSYQTYSVWNVVHNFLLQFPKAKLVALEVMLTLSKYVTSDVILDRLVPFMVGIYLPVPGLDSSDTCVF